MPTNPTNESPRSAISIPGRTPHGRGLAFLLALATALASFGMGGCVAPGSGGALAGLPDGPLGGEALEQRKHDLDRAYRDMVHLHTTMQSLIDRHESHSLSTFDRFVDAYMGTHLDPLLGSEWQSSHPELMARDASLRFIQAEILIMMRYPRRVQEVRNEIERRFEGRGELLIRYPVGEYGTIGNGLEILEERKWRG